jgi:hypothetical protein
MHNQGSNYLSSEVSIQVQQILNLPNAYNLIRRPLIASVSLHESCESKVARYGSLVAEFKPYQHIVRHLTVKRVPVFIEHPVIPVLRARIPTGSVFSLMQEYMVEIDPETRKSIDENL